MPVDHRGLPRPRRHALTRVLESFEAARLRHVHPGPVAIPCRPSLVVVRDEDELYPSGTVVTWTCSPSDSEVARLAQGTTALEIEADVSGALGGGLVLQGRASFTLG